MLKIILSLFILTTFTNAEFRGWDHAANFLIKSGIERDLVLAAFNDPRLPEFKPIPYKLRPKESSRSYADFLKQKKITEGKNFINQNYNLLKKIQKEYQIDPYVIVAIFLVETNLGKNTGDLLVFERIARVCSVGTLGNPEFNLKENLKLYSDTTVAGLKERAKKLEETFCPELVALFRIAKKNNLSVYSFKGSIAGAFGFPQFMPLSYEKHAVDYNQNGETSLYEVSDSLASIAAFLKFHGYSNKYQDQYKAVMSYNNSQAYAETILKLAQFFQKKQK